MKLDKRVEALVRAALDAAVRRDSDRMVTAIRAFPDDESVNQGVSLGLAIAGYVLVDVHKGKPTDGQLRVVAEDLARMEEWAGYSADQIHAFTSRLLAGRPLVEVLPGDDVIMMSFIVPAVLLSGFRAKTEDWEDYLDRAEDAIERG